MTNFSIHQLKALGLSFYFDGNSKITGANWSYVSPAPNAFSLLPIVDCPLATLVCMQSCYAVKMINEREGLRRAYLTNSISIRRALKRSPRELAGVFSEWAMDYAKEGFRWHIAGDVFSAAYARFIRQVATLTPRVTFTIYTRSFSYVSQLVGPQNLVINISADRNNYSYANDVALHHGLRLCYLATPEDHDHLPDLRPGSVIFPDYELRGRDLDEPTTAPWWQRLTPAQKRMVCPVDFFGHSSTMRCGPCGRCLKQVAPVQYAS